MTFITNMRSVFPTITSLTFTIVTITVRQRSRKQIKINQNHLLSSSEFQIHCNKTSDEAVAVELFATITSYKIENEFFMFVKEVATSERIKLKIKVDSQTRYFMNVQRDFFVGQIKSRNVLCVFVHVHFVSSLVWIIKASLKH